MSNPDNLPNVPDELTHCLVTEALQKTQAEWQACSLDDVHAAIPQPQTTEHGSAVVLDPTTCERDETYTMVLGLPYQQGWKPSMYIRAEYARQMIAPEARMVVLPNNTHREQYYDFTKEERAKIIGGNFGPFYERHVRVLEALGVRGEVMLTGYSLGGLTALGIAAKCSDKFWPTTINADEPTTGGREPRDVQRAFMKSGGWSEQRAAIADAKLPVLSAALSTGRLALDYARFGLSSFEPNNRALAAGMARGDLGALVREARSTVPDAVIKLGYVAGSQLFLPDSDSFEGIDVREYSGPGAHMHATGDNVAAHALMIVDAQARHH